MTIAGSVEPGCARRGGGYEAADTRAEAIERGYEALGEIVGAGPANMAVVGSATAGFIQALSSFDFSPGDATVTTRNDYTSNQIQYLALAKRLGVEIIHAADLPEGGVDPESVGAMVRARRPRLVAVSWIPTNSGLVQDVEAVGAVCEEWGVPYVVDACQAVGQVPVDVSRLRCDYLSATARKFMVAQARAWSLAASLRDALGAVPGVRVLDRGATRCAIVTIEVAGRHADSIVRAMAARRINVVTSLREYGIYDFEAKGVYSAVRLSPHYYNTETEVTEAVAALGEIVTTVP